ncbi:hypothetical protein [Acidaminobacter sp.]|uniref:hypothetical protein n=1 Tax=Acidaminobacter sp. TaxID=1872102 RepID=UPI002562FD97|nr:hypothetical protein [Acidaminobacter sp.]MDK9711737.1 hypothetical protein [Acidaminobacter sp.]
MHKSLIALAAAATLLLTQSPTLSLGAETTGAQTVSLEESASVSAPWAPSVWPSTHWSLPYVRVLVEAQILSLYEVEMLNRRFGPDGLISSAYFETYAARTLKTILPGTVLSSNSMTREQMADTLYRMITYSSYEAMPTPEQLDQDQLIWKDAELFSGFGYQASLALRWTGIASGIDGYYHPQRLVTAAEALTTLAKTKDNQLRTPLQPAPEEPVAQTTESCPAATTTEITTSGANKTSAGL